MMLFFLLPASCQQPAQKGVDAQGRSQTPNFPPPLSPPPGVPPYAPGVMSNGRCMASGRGYIANLSDDPTFRALIQEDIQPWNPYHERGIAEEKAWAQRMKAFVPLLLKGLQSENGCIQLEAVSYLAKLKDPRAIEPFYELIQKYPLETEVASEALKSLAEVYNDSRVIPYLVDIVNKAPEGPVLNIALDAASRENKDEKLWRALVRRYERTPDSSGTQILLQAIANQAEAVRDKQEVLAFFRRDAARPGFDYRASAFARIIASPDTFEDLAAYYNAHCKDSNGDCGGIAGTLINIGGPKLRPFWLQEMRESQDARFRSYAASQALNVFAKELPKKISSGNELLTRLDEQCGEALPFADQGAITGILSHAPEAQPEVAPQVRAAYWEQAVARLAKRGVNCYWIYLQLYNIYGPQGLQNDEKALAAITAALDHYADAYGSKKPQEWIGYQEKLREKLRSRQIGAAIKIGGFSPENASRPAGPWKGELILPADAADDVQSGTPFAYLEFTDSAGRVTLVPSAVQLEQSSPGALGMIPFVVSPLKPSTGKVAQVRLRLLFLPRAKGFSGVILSPTVQIK